MRKYYTRRDATSEFLSSTEKINILVTHVYFSYGHSWVGENTEKIRKLEQLLKDFSQFLSGLDDVSITILTDPKITAHLSDRALDIDDIDRLYSTD